MSKVKDENCGIYAIINKVNCKMYVGKSVNLKKRKGNHFYYLRNNKHQNDHLQKSWNKYGEENFEWKILEFCSKEELFKREQYYINHYNSSNWCCGYNIEIIFEGKTVVSEETREKLRKVNIGRVVSEETKAKLSIARKKRVITEETKEKVSKSLMGNKRRSGSLVSSLTREKISNALIGRVVSLETREKISNKLTGRIFSLETREKMSKNSKGKNLGKARSLETREKISIAQKGKPKGYKKEKRCKKEKIKKSNKGKILKKTLSIETRRKISEKRKGVKFSEETRRRISLGVRMGKGVSLSKKIPIGGYAIVLALCLFCWWCYTLSIYVQSKNFVS